MDAPTLATIARYTHRAEGFGGNGPGPYQAIRELTAALRYLAGVIEQQEQRIATLEEQTKVTE